MLRTHFALIALLLCSGCAGVEPPGELVGRYQVRGELLDNSCGQAALPADDPLRFQAQVRDDGERAYWLMNPPARPGTLSASGEFSFESATDYRVSEDMRAAELDILDPDPEAFVREEALEPVDPDLTARSCTLRVVETMRGSLHRSARDGELDAEADEDLTADNEIAIRAAGGDCSFVQQSAGGPFETLPCRARYAIRGELLAERPEP